ncbi:TIGR00159 family protein, partial [Clostridium botulinum]|nr:TIGR00159 family protein [Clostridium botulinum]
MYNFIYIQKVEVIVLQDFISLIIKSLSNMSFWSILDILV